MRPILITTIPHRLQRYPTVGDYERLNSGPPARVESGLRGDGTTEYVTVSELGNADYEFLVAVHELVEWYLTERRGISEEAITAFDLRFEDEGDAIPGFVDEPGESPAAPYHREHVFATKVERMVAEELGVDWGAYEATVDALFHVERPEIWHYIVSPGRVACGAGYPNMRSTEITENVTCAECNALLFSCPFCQGKHSPAPAPFAAGMKVIACSRAPQGFVFIIPAPSGGATKP